jgi:hypothetical protein
MPPLLSPASGSDVVARHPADDECLSRSPRSAIDNVGSPFSARRVADFMKAQRRSIRHETVLNYLAALAWRFPATQACTAGGSDAYLVVPGAGFASASCLGARGPGTAGCSRGNWIARKLWMMCRACSAGISASGSAGSPSISGRRAEDRPRPHPRPPGRHRPRRRRDRHDRPRRRHPHRPPDHDPAGPQHQGRAVPQGCPCFLGHLESMSWD